MIKREEAKTVEVDTFDTVCERGAVTDCAVTIGGKTDTEQLIIQANASQSTATPLIKLQDREANELARIHTTNEYNLFMGKEAGININITGVGNAGKGNVGIGYRSLYSCSTGYRNFGLGTWALMNLTTAYWCTAIGTGALSNVTSSHSSTAIGTSAGEKVTSAGHRNVFIGHRAGLNTTSKRNVLVGAHSGYYLSSGQYNTFLGYGTGVPNATTGSSNILIGYSIDVPAAGNSNKLNIGNTIYGDLTNDKIAIGAVPLTNECDVGLLKDGVLAMKETSTPTADANYGKVYTKNDNKLYFQDGAGTEHEIALV